MSNLRNYNLNADHKFYNATFDSSISISLNGLPFTIQNSAQIAYIKQIKDDNTSRIFQNALYGITLKDSSSIISIYGAGYPCASTDEYEVGINGIPIGSNIDQDVIKVIVQNPDYAYYTSPQNLVTDMSIGDVSNNWINQSNLIETITYKNIYLYVAFKSNNSTGNQLQVLSKHTYDGSLYVLPTSSEYQKTLGDVSINIIYPFNTEGINYIQVQTKATDVSILSGVVTIDYVKEY